jgi:hypothetical protein
VQQARARQRLLRHRRPGAQHAILGASEACIATHPSDMCVALAALEAVVHVQSRAAGAGHPFADFHRLPGERRTRQHARAGELITHIELPPLPGFEAHSAYLKVRERASYAFALVSVAAALDIDEDGRVRSARIALGGVAHKPWRDPRRKPAVGCRPGKAFEAVPRSLLEAAAEVAAARRAQPGQQRLQDPDGAPRHRAGAGDRHAGTLTNTPTTAPIAGPHMKESSHDRPDRSPDAHPADAGTGAVAWACRLAHRRPGQGDRRPRYAAEHPAPATWPTAWW